MTRVIAVTSKGVLDSETGEITKRLTIEKLLITEPGGVIVGTNLYPVLAKLAPEVKSDEGWTMMVNLQQRRAKPMDSKDKRLTGKLYISRITYRRAKVGGRKKRYRPPSIKWVVLELGLFMETPPTELTPVKEAGEAIIGLAERRGIKPRPSPGSFGSAMLRVSSQWKAGMISDRGPAPRFISELARSHLPGNYYAVSPILKNKRLDHCFYLDQEASHHKIAESIVLPHPSFLHGRGFLRAVEKDEFRQWLDDPAILVKKGHVGLLCCLVEVGTIPRQMEHLYPPWAHRKGRRIVWLWTPELRLVSQDHRIHIRSIYCALTSIRPDWALNEYAEWALTQRNRNDRQFIKSALLAAYGMLACRADRPVEVYSVHGRKPSPRSEIVELPLLPKVFRSEVKNRKTPLIQNVVARGVIEAETRTRSIEYARELESEGIKVAQIYADGLLVVTDQLPLTIPTHWRVVNSLTRVTAPHPNSIVSDQMVRLPGILGASQEAYVRNFPAGPVREGFAGRIEQTSRDLTSLA